MTSKNECKEQCDQKMKERAIAFSSIPGTYRVTEYTKRKSEAVSLFCPSPLGPLP